jgi:hypothetical protein
MAVDDQTGYFFNLRRVHAAPGCVLDISVNYRCDNKHVWLSAHDCQFPTPTSQNQEAEQQIRIFGAD